MVVAFVSKFTAVNFVTLLCQHFINSTFSVLKIEEPSQMSQVTQGSPVRIKPIMFFGGSPKIKGSFLHKAAEAEKAVEKNSPKKVKFSK